MEGRIIEARVLYYSPIHYSPYFYPDQKCFAARQISFCPSIILSYKSARRETDKIMILKSGDISYDFRLRENNRTYYSPLHYSPYFYPDQKCFAAVRMKSGRHQLRLSDELIHLNGPNDLDHGAITSRTRCFTSFGCGNPPSTFRSQTTCSFAITRNSPAPPGTNATSPMSDSNVDSNSWLNHAARSSQRHFTPSVVNNQPKPSTNRQSYTLRRRRSTAAITNPDTTIVDPGSGTEFGKT